MPSPSGKNRGIIHYLSDQPANFSLQLQHSVHKFQSSPMSFPKNFSSFIHSSTPAFLTNWYNYHSLMLFCHIQQRLAATQPGTVEIFWPQLVFIHATILDPEITIFLFFYISSPTHSFISCDISSSKYWHSKTIICGIPGARLYFIIALFWN